MQTSLVRFGRAVACILVASFLGAFCLAADQPRLCTIDDGSHAWLERNYSSESQRSPLLNSLAVHGLVWGTQPLCLERVDFRRGGGALLSLTATRSSDVDVFVAFPGGERPPDWLGEYGWRELDRVDSAHVLFRKRFMPGSQIWFSADEQEARALLGGVVVQEAIPPAPIGWDRYEWMLKNHEFPNFPGRSFLVVDHGAVGDYRTDNFEPFRRAIDSCANAGGGTVVVPPGQFVLNGPIHLRSGVRLHLQAGAALRFRGELGDYLVGAKEHSGCVRTRYEGADLFHASPLIYGLGLTDVAVTGEGPSSLIDGGQIAVRTPGTEEGFTSEQAERLRADGTTFMSWSTSVEDRAALRNMTDRGLALSRRVFGAGRNLRVPLVQFLLCRRVMVENVRLENAPFWNLVTSQTQDVTVRGVVIRGYNSNNDGIDIDSCARVLVEDCDIECVDDGVVVKSGRDADGWRAAMPSEDIVIRNCRVTSRWGDIAFGSELSGGVRNVFILGCGPRADPPTMFTPKAEGFMIMFKSNFDRGGVVQDIHVRDCEVNWISASYINYGYRGGFVPPLYRGLHFSGLRGLREVVFANKSAAVTTNVVMENCGSPTVRVLDDASQPLPDRAKLKERGAPMPQY